MTTTSINHEKNAYFFVITPLNYLYAVEAKRQIPSAYKSHMILLTTFQPIIDQLKIVIDEEEWDTVVYRPEKQWGMPQSTTAEKLKYAIYARFYMDRILKRVQPQDDIFVGNIRNSICRYILSKTHYNKQYILDDGLATINYIKNNSDSGNKITFKNMVFGMFLPGNKINHKKITFFSIYEHMDFSPFRFVKNDLKALKSVYNEVEWKPENVVLFIGQYLPKANIITKQHYFDVVNKIISLEKEKGYKVVYITHRNDDIVLPDSWDVLKGSLPVELLLTELKTTPKRIWSFYSTALTNLQILFENKSICLYIKPPEKWISSKHKKSIETVYSYLESVEPLYGKVVDYDHVDEYMI